MFHNTGLATRNDKIYKINTDITTIPVSYNNELYNVSEQKVRNIHDITFTYLTKPVVGPYGPNNPLNHSLLNRPTGIFNSPQITITPEQRINESINLIMNAAQSLQQQQHQQLQISGIVPLPIIQTPQYFAPQNQNRYSFTYNQRTSTTDIPGHQNFIQQALISPPVFPKRSIGINTGNDNDDVGEAMCKQSRPVRRRRRGLEF